MSDRQLRRVRMAAVLALAAVGAIAGFSYGAAIAIPGAMLDGEVLSGGNRRIFFTGLVASGPGLCMGAVVGAVVALLVRRRRARGSAATEADG